MVNHCSVCTNNSKKNPEVSFFTYPKFRDRRNDWLLAVGREDLIIKLDDEKKRPHHRICDAHFPENNIIYSRHGFVKYYSDDAFPTLNIPKRIATILRHKKRLETAKQKSKLNVSTVVGDFPNNKVPIPKLSINTGASQNKSTAVNSFSNDILPVSKVIRNAATTTTTSVCANVFGQIVNVPITILPANDGTAPSHRLLLNSNVLQHIQHNKVQIPQVSKFLGASTSTSQPNQIIPEQNKVSIPQLTTIVGASTSRIPPNPIIPEQNKVSIPQLTSIVGASTSRIQPNPIIPEQNKVPMPQLTSIVGASTSRPQLNPNIPQSNIPSKQMPKLFVNRSVKSTAVSSNFQQNKVESNTNIVSGPAITGPKNDIRITHVHNRVVMATRSVQTDQAKVIKDNVTEDKFSQTKIRLTDCSAQNRKLVPLKRFKRKITKSDLNQIATEDFLELCDKFMSRNMSQFIKWQIKLKTESSENLNSDAFIFFALDLYYSGSAYTFLGNTFSLPSLNSLQNFVKPIKTKLDERTLTVLKIKVKKMVPEEKICSVCVDCMKLKENMCYDFENDQIIGFHEINGKQKPVFANFVIVIMIRGIIHKWSQPVTYAFLEHCKYSQDVSSWIDETITSLLKIGFDIRVLITGIGTNFVGDSKSRAVNVEKTFFEINGRKLYYAFDVPQLMKCVTNGLQCCNFVFYDGNKVAKWSDIKEMYKHDKMQEAKLAPKLTDNHMKPNDFLTMPVKVAAQILSYSVSRAIRFYTDFKVMDSSAKDTAEFIEHMNNLFDILNSSTLRDSDNKYKEAYAGADFQVCFLHAMLEFLKNLKLEKISSQTDVTNTANFIREFQISIMTILKLHEDLEYFGIPTIRTKRINLDGLQMFFGKVRQEAGSGQEPTCNQFIKVFKNEFVSSILKRLDNSHCREDFNSMVRKLKDCQYLCSTPQKHIKEETTKADEIPMKTSDYEIELPVQNALDYISRHLYKKYKEYHKCSGSPNIPLNFVVFVCRLEAIFCQYFSSKNFSTNLSKCVNIANDIYNLMSTCAFQMPCNCFPINFILKLFIRLRIHHVIKQNNEILKNDKVQQIVFRVNHL